MKRIDLDLNLGTSQTIKLMQFDSKCEKIIINVLKDRYLYDLTGKTLRLQGIKADGKAILIPTKVISKNEIEVEITEQMTIVNGLLRLQLLVFGADGCLKNSNIFSVSVGESLEIGEVIASTNDFLEIKNTLIKVDEWDRYFSETSGKLEEKYTPRLNELGTQLEDNVQEVNTLKTNKVDKVQGKGLSTNDYSDTEKGEVAKVKSKADITYVDTKVANISSGTPLFASGTTGMTDTTKNYVNTSDGFLYTYNGSAFVKTTVQYQSTGVSDLGVTHRKLEQGLQDNFLPYYGEPLSGLPWVSGSYIKSSGDIQSGSGYSYCKLKVNPNESYKIKTQRVYEACGYTVLDSNNNKIISDSASSGSQTTIETEIIIPENGAYLCFNNYTGNTFTYLITKNKYNLKKFDIAYTDLPQELRDNFTLAYNDVTNSISWIADKYIKSDGTFQTNAGATHGYAEIPVSPNTECKITGKHSWAISCYVVKDSMGKVVLTDGGDNGVVTSFTDKVFTIPSDGAKLYINKYEFKNLQIKNKLQVITSVKSPLEGKTLLFSGDSICQGMIETSPGVYNGQYGWAEIIKENNPTCTMKNYGQGGTTIAKKSGKTDSILERLTTMQTEYPNADYIILEGGVNDCYTTSIAFGTVSTGYNATLDETTFCGAMESLCKNAILKWKGKKIGFIITFKVPTAQNFKKYMDSAKEICEKWSIPYIDLYTKSGLEYNIDEIKTLYSYGGGGLHPNIEGYKIITPKIESWIKSL